MQKLQMKQADTACMFAYMSKLIYKECIVRQIIETGVCVEVSKTAVQTRDYGGLYK